MTDLLVAGLLQGLGALCWAGVAVLALRRAEVRERGKR
jgi:hypothetical protein